MPPRLNQGQSSFSVSQESQQVICPLKNQDGTNCRKRCVGVSLLLAITAVDLRWLLMCFGQEKRFRSMQEHIRRAHPDHYIPKLPATEESFQVMINTPPSARPRPAPTSDPSNSPFASGRGASGPANIGGFTSSPYSHDQRPTSYGSPAPSRSLEDQFPAAATAAVALAQLHGSGKDSDWASDAVS